MDRAPNLFIIGAMKAGTSSLHNALSDHPDIFMSAIKEPAYFADPVELRADSRIAASYDIAGNAKKYERLFSKATSERYLGESSTHYTKAPFITGVPERMAQLSPEPRIIYLVRDPVERTLSHYLHAVRMRYEYRSCIEALQANPKYIAVSDYATQIRPYLRLFGHRRVLLLVYERLIEDPLTAINSVLIWLGLDTESTPSTLPHLNRTPDAVDLATGPRALHQIGSSSVYRKFLAKLIPKRARSVIHRTLHRPIDPEEVRDSAIVDYLRAELTPTVEALEFEFGMKFSRWKTVRPIQDPT